MKNRKKIIANSFQQVNRFNAGIIKMKRNLISNGSPDSCLGNTVYSIIKPSSYTQKSSIQSYAAFMIYNEGEFVHFTFYVSSNAFFNRFRNFKNTTFCIKCHCEDRNEGFAIEYIEEFFGKEFDIIFT